jgi:hypothetical protein
VSSTRAAEARPCSCLLCWAAAATATEEDEEEVVVVVVVAGSSAAEDGFLKMEMRWWR